MSETGLQVRDARVAYIWMQRVNFEVGRGSEANYIIVLILLVCIASIVHPAIEEQFRCIVELCLTEVIVPFGQVSAHKLFILATNLVGSALDEIVHHKKLGSNH